MQRHDHDTARQRHTSQRRRGNIALLVATLALPAAALLGPGAVQAHGTQRLSLTVPGPQPDSSTVLVDGRTITPAGRQTILGTPFGGGDLPVNAVLSPDGQHLLVVNSGTGIQSLQVVNTSNSAVAQTITYTVPGSVFVGAAYSPGGTRVYASGGGSDLVHTYTVDPSSGQLTPASDVAVSSAAQTHPFPTGLSVSPDGGSVYVADNLSNDVAVIDTASNTVSAHIPVGSYPYTTLASPDGKAVYVSNWGDGTVSVIDAATKSVVRTISLALGNVTAPATSHPSALALSPDGRRLYVSLSNSDAVAVVDTTNGAVIALLSVSPYRRAPLSSSPEGLVVSPDGTRLYVALAGNNAIAVFKLNAFGPDRAQLLGRIPTAWYPTAVVASMDNQTLFVTNAKGYGAGPNNKPPYYPNPTRLAPGVIQGVTGYADGYCNCTVDNYSGTMIEGTLSAIPVPGDFGRLQLYNRLVAYDNHEGIYSLQFDRRSPGNPIPVAGGASPIKHVIYIIKENRTYDQVFGDEASTNGLGNGDPSLTLFPRSVTPNLHALAERYGLLDNFYANAEVSADGHNWAMSANASDYNEKMWPQNYAPSPGRNRPYDFEGDSTINLSPGGYLWDAAAQAGITYRDYGEFYAFSGGSPVTQTVGTPCTGPTASSYGLQPASPGYEYCFPPSTINPTTTPNLVGHIDPYFRGYDLKYREADRVAEWARDNGFSTGNPFLPALEILRLPNDHTSGTRVGAPTPQALVAENDAAVGQVVDIVSHSTLWRSTAIFVTEDDAQNGPDHVDAHRTESLVISPYTFRLFPRVDHTLYDTAAMVHTIELILGLRPLSQYDANSMPLAPSFHSTPIAAPYNAIAATIPISTVNTAASYGAVASAQMDFSREDRAPMDAFNHILWHAVKGAQTAYPQVAPDGSSHTKGSGDD